MTTSLSAAELAHLVTAVPGVRAIEPGIGSTLRALGSRMRQQDPQQARFGVIVEEGSSRAVIEIGIDGSRPVKDIVRDVQETILRSLSQASESGDASEAREDSASSDVGHGVQDVSPADTGLSRTQLRSRTTAPETSASSRRTMRDPVTRRCPSQMAPKTGRPM